jgi:protein FRG1
VSLPEASELNVIDKQQQPEVPSAFDRQRPTSIGANRIIMVKPLTFKGDKKPKKRKRADADAGEGAGPDDNAERQVKAAKAAEDPEPSDDDSWVSADAVSDVSGPIMFVLPSEPPTALACDANGKVFAMPVENIIDGNPSTAEPHDVRQVWVANRIAGTEHFRFKGHHGKYVLGTSLLVPSHRKNIITSLTPYTCADTCPATRSASSPRRQTPSRRSRPST